jgi:exodeoxyribonuclease VII small subunit
MKTSAHKPPASFEAALQELETLVKSLEDGGAPLEASLQAYERGTMLLAYCQETLDQAEQKIHKLDNGVLRAFHVEDEPAQGEHAN